MYFSSFQRRALRQLTVYAPLNPINKWKDESELQAAVLTFSLEFIRDVLIRDSTH